MAKEWRVLRFCFYFQQYVCVLSLSLCVCVCVCDLCVGMYTWVKYPWRPEESIGSPELEFQASVSYPVWVLERELSPL